MGDHAKFENLIAMAVPVFFISILIELVVSVLLKRKVYRLNDSISDMSAGMMQELVGVFTKVLLFGVYILVFDWVHKPENLVPGRSYGMPVNILTWILAFLLVDFIYYWFHRNSHNVAIIWGSHEAHHSSQEYNLSVALRQGAFQRLFSFPYYLPLALIGLSPVQFIVCSQVNTLYQFFIHTRLVNKLGFLEYFMNTPSHHRVHHGVNPRYIDKNHAGMLIIWDRLFGTFEPETEEPYYGTVKPLTTFNPVWAQLHYWWSLVELSAKCRGFDRVKVWFARPGWKPDYLGGKHAIPEINPGAYKKFDVDNALSLKLYATLVYVVSLPFFLILQRTKGLPLLQQLMLSVPVVIGLASAGGLMMHRRWGLWLEMVRLPLFVVMIAGITSVLAPSYFHAAIAVVVGLTLGQIYWFYGAWRRPLSAA